MRLVDALVIGFCAVAGYALVNFLVNRGPGVSGDEPVTLTNWYRVLGVSESASKSEIVAAYESRRAKSEPAAAARLDAAYDLGMRRFR